METVFWAPTHLVENYSFYLAAAAFGFVASLLLIFLTIVNQVGRRIVHPLFVVAVLGLSAPVVLEPLGVDMLTPAGHAYAVSYTFFGFVVMAYGVGFRRSEGWLPLFTFPAIGGVSLWFAAIGAEITASI